LELAERSGRLPKIIVPVHLSGQPSEMREIERLVRYRGIRIVEDASHAIGASYEGYYVGGCRHSDIAVFSFHPVKIVTTGEGGICLTNDPDLAARLALLRSHGITRDPTLMEKPEEGSWHYEQVELGYNYRLTDIQAALGASQLQRLPERHARRDALARRYDDCLGDLPLKLPARLNDRQSAHHLYVVEIDTRRGIERRHAHDALRAAGIGANVHYIPIHTQPFYRRRGFGAGDFPASERYYEAAITLPLFPAMTETQQDHVVATLARALT